MTPGSDREAVNRFFIKTAYVAVSWILSRGQRDLHGEQSLAVESHIDLLKLGKALDQKPRANQQHERKRNLNDNQRAANEMSARVAG